MIHKLWRVLPVSILIAMAGGLAAWGRELPEAPPGFVDLLRVDPRGGRVVRPPDGDLSKPDAKWKDQTGARLVYEPIYRGQGAHRLILDVPPTPKSPRLGRGLWSQRGFPVKPNRDYIVSVLAKTNFDRAAGEFDVTLHGFDEKGGRLGGARRLLGLPSKTEGPDGWRRLEWRVTTPTDERVHEGRASLGVNVVHSDQPFEILLADIAFVELPPEPLKPLGRGEGVEFPGGVGDLPMKVVSAQELDGRLVVTTTGAKYEFNTQDDTILASQRIEFPRDLAKWRSSLSLKGLRIDKQNDDVCVLSNDQMTIGVQADSLLVVSPARELEMNLTNLLGGDWNRYARGSLLSLDDFGGFTVSPYTPPGTGRQPRSKLLTPGLEFVNLTPVNALSGLAWDGGEAVKKIDTDRPYNTEDPGPADPGWEAQWSTSPGEFFCASVFPPRPFPWEASFKTGWRLVHRQTPLDHYAKANFPFISDWLLWNFDGKTWGHSYATEHEPLDPVQTKKTIEAARELGLGAIPYISAYWVPTRDPDEYISAVRKYKDEYDINGVYSDGIEAMDWMVAYKEMRMLRELFPSGSIIVHDSMNQDGWVGSQLRPFIHTYATTMYLAENTPSKSGIHWQYPRYVTTQFRKANSIGTTKGDKWTDAEGEVMGERNALVCLVYNGRNNYGYNYLKYNAALEALRDLWEEKGDEPFFYDRYYLPKAQELTGYRIGRAAMPIASWEVSGGEATLTLKTLTPRAVVHYTKDGTTPTRESPQYHGPITVEPGATISARAFADDLAPSAVAKERPPAAE